MPGYNCKREKIMSIYPSSIPDTDDYPDRTDDVDWITAERYNEIKNETLAICAEMGVLPKGSYDTVKARLDALGEGWQERSSASAVDYAIGDLEKNSAWHDLDLSSIVPAGAKAVRIFVQIKATEANDEFKIRKNGRSDEYIIDGLRTQAASVEKWGTLEIACDTSRVIEYWATNVELWTTINLTVVGWYL
jgi:hypothetical protein